MDASPYSQLLTPEPGSAVSAAAAVNAASVSAEDGAPSRTLYWVLGAPPSWRVALALHEKGLSFRSELLAVEEGAMLQQRILVLNPRGRVPILVDGSARLYGSLAILHFLEASAPGHLASGGPNQPPPCARHRPKVTRYSAEPRAFPQRTYADAQMSEQ